MNICFFSQEYPPETHVGGIGTYTYNMARALTRLGHTVHVITSTQHSDQSHKDDNVWVHRIRNRKIRPKELWHFRYSYSVAKKVSNIGCKFDVVQSSEYASEAFWFAFRRQFPLITRLATPLFLIEKLNGKAFFSPPFFSNWMEKKQTLRSDGIFTSTKAIAKKVTEEWGISPSRVKIIPNGVQISRIVRLGEEGAVPENLKDKTFLLYFGRLEERKGVHILAQALSHVLKKYSDIHMVFAGADSGYRGVSMIEHIKKETFEHKNRIIYLENMPQENLFPIVKTAKIVILPSLWEAFGFVCVEAMALGRPVIATSGSGFEEIIENNISGYLVKPGNSELLTEKILCCLNNEKDLSRVSEGARRRAKDFEVSKVATELLAYYEKMIREWLKKRG